LRLLVIFLLLGVTPASADLLQLAQGSEMTVRFSIPGWSLTNSPAALPASVSLQLTGPSPAGSTLTAIPGSSAEYYSGILLKGWIRSLDGSASSLLFDADASRLGLAMGSLVAEALYGGGTMIEGDAYLSQNLAESIFGTSGQAEFLVQNLGKSISIGLGDGYSLNNAVVTPMTTSAFLQSAGAEQQIGVAVPVPEPALWGVLGAAALLLLMAIQRRPLLAQFYSGRGGRQPKGN
jgi:hypothetical protein